MESILVLEDDENLRELVGDTLEDAGYRVTRCADPESAIRSARQQPYHLILSDVRMAGAVDGVGAIEEIKKFRPHIRSVIMTGFASQEVPLRAARIKADDYLLKGDSGFGIGRLLETIRSVLDRQNDSENWFSRVLQVPVHRLFRGLRECQESRIFDLTYLRQGFLQKFYLLVRPGHLSKEMAYALFLQLEPLELRFFEVIEGHLAALPATLESLARDYQALERQLEQNQGVWREDAQFPLADFERFYQRVRQGFLSQTHFESAARLRGDPKARNQNAENYALYHWIWSRNEEVVDGLVGRSLGEFKLTERVPGALPKVQFYKAQNPNQPGEEFWVLCLPVDAENRGLVELDKLHTQALYQQEIYGCYFTVFARQTLSLKAQIPPDGLPIQEAWKLLQPVFYQVGRYHREAKYSGGFGLRDIHRPPGKAAYLVRFDDRQFREAQDWKEGGRLRLDLSFAPEAPGWQGQVPPAADQAVLARILIEVSLGKGLEPIPSIMLHQLDHPRILSLWLRLADRLAPAHALLQRMCQPRPEQRFPTLGEAYVRLQRALGG